MQDYTLCQESLGSVSFKFFSRPINFWQIFDFHGFGFARPDLKFIRMGHIFLSKSGGLDTFDFVQYKLNLLTGLKVRIIIHPKRIQKIDTDEKI